ncbi:hypothetical protein Tco_1203239 [Tanacetum coccineum]
MYIFYNCYGIYKCMLELKKMNPKAHEWLNKIPPEYWARSPFLGRALSDLLLNNIYEVFNRKIVGGREKPVITLLESIREYCMKIIVNVQSFIDKCDGPLIHTTTRIMKSIRKEAHLLKVQWNGRIKKWEMTWIPYKYVVAACWNMDLNGQQVATLKALGGNNAKVSGSASGQAEPVVGQGGLGVSQVPNAYGSGVGAVICESNAGGQPGRACVGFGSQSSSLVSSPNGREMGDGIPTQSSAASGESEWAIM